MRSVLHSLFAVNVLWEFSKTGKINQPLDVKFNHQLLSHIWRSHWSALLSSYTYSPTLKLYQGQFMCNIILSAFPSKVESHFRSVLIKKKKHLRGLSVRSVCTGTGVHTNLHHGLYRVCLHFYQSERHEMSFSFQRVNPEKLHTGKCTFLHTTDTLQI